MIVALAIVGLVALASLASSVLIAKELRAAASANTDALEGAWRGAHAERQDSMDRMMSTIGVHYDSQLKLEQMRENQATALETDQSVLYKSEEEQDRDYADRRSAESLFDADSNADIGELYSALGINPTEE